jgi:hypothetical protein
MTASATTVNAAAMAHWPSLTVEPLAQRLLFGFPASVAAVEVGGDGDQGGQSDGQSEGVLHGADISTAWGLG